jgi:lysophospholipase L1-like esterase
MSNYSQLTIIGDSLVLCKNLKQKKRWPEILKKKLKKKIKKLTLNVRAINGITTTEALKKINFSLKNDSVVLLLFGANDSTYYQSLKGKPRVSIKLFNKNYLSIIKKTRKKYNNKIFLITGHKFLRKRLEGNKKTHNISFLKYKKSLYKIAKKTNCEIIDTYSNLLKLKPKSYCMPLPDGLHQNYYGSKKYSEINYNKINKLFS